jgi:hypothetical protein
MAVHYVGTELNSFSLNTVLLQLRFQERRHTKDIVTMNRITRYTCLNQCRILPMLSDLVDSTWGFLPRQQDAG